jgi:plasmid replication initiation protein
VPTKDNPAINSLKSETFDTRRHEAEQPSLFATEDLVIPDSIKTFRKAVGAIQSIPINSSHTLNTSKLFDAFILLAQLDFANRGPAQVERIRVERISPLFETRVTDLARLAGIPGKNYKRLHDDLNHLFEMVLQWNVLGEDEVLFDTKAHFLSSLGIGKGKNRGKIRFSIEPAILEIVLEPRNWATLSLKAKYGLGTVPSYHLYQQCFRYINTQAKVTATLPTEMWIDLLVGRSNYVKTDSQGNKYTANYADFKRRVLTDAITRVNELKALNHTLQLKEFKAGNRVAKLQFAFIPKQQASLGLPLTWPEDGIKVLTNMGFKEAEISDMSRSNSYEEVAESLNRLQAAEVRSRARGKPITSRKAYFSGILAKVAEGAAGAEIEGDRLEEEIRIQSEAKVDKERQDRFRDQFLKHQADVSTKRFFELDARLRQNLISEFENSNAGKSAKVLLEKGWSPRNTGALVILKCWLQETNSEIYNDLYPEPEDKSYESWSAWRLEKMTRQDS